MNKDLLELYSDYLLSSFSYTTATGLSRMSTGEVSHDKITPFLASEEMDSRALWRLVKPLARQVEDEDGVLIIDDTIEEKPYTDESELVCSGTMSTPRGEASRVSTSSVRSTTSRAPREAPSR
jgi:hypothetical protein